jgi:hypothetical protein
MAKAAIRVVVDRVVGRWLWSLGGLGEADRTNTYLAMDTLCRHVAKTWHNAHRAYFEMPIPVRCAERDAFLRHDGSTNFFDHLVDTLSEELAQAWSGKNQGEEKC